MTAPPVASAPKANTSITLTLSTSDTADTAAVDLFTSYNNYRWAVEHGILN